ncbi:MAG: hypothetical protein IJ475_03030 [Bacilli bacterium]|nr:hypothetical protein [Bacilli bacterium]
MEKKIKEVKKDTKKVKDVVATEVKDKKDKTSKAVKKSNIKKNKINYVTTEETNELKKFLIVIVVVLLCVGGIYLVTRAFVTKDLFKDEEPTTEEVTPVVPNYDIAIMGTMLNRPEDTYYVVIYNTVEGDYVADMSALVSSYNAKDGHKHIYTVDLSDYMNQSYYDPENVNVKAKTLEEVKVGDITLIKVKKGKIDKYIVDLAKMKKELGLE